MDMYEKHIRAVHKICWKVLDNKYGVDLDDLIQEAYLIIKLKLEPNFNPELSSAAHYLFKYLPHHLRRYQKKYMLCDSLNKPLPEYEDVELIDILEDESIDIEETITDKVFNSEIQKAIEKELNTLSELESQIIKHRYFYNMTLKKTAAKVGINSIERVRSLQSRAERKLRAKRNLIRLSEEILEDRAYRHVTLKQFKYTRTSAVEKAIGL